MVAYNLFFFGFVRERLYLYYGIHVSFIALHQIIWFGLGFEYLWPNYPGLNNTLDIFAGGGLFFFLGLFTMDFLQTRKNTPRLHYLLMITTSLAGISGLLIFVLERKFVLGPANNIIIIHIPLIFIVASICFLKNLRQAYVFLLSWSIALLGALYLALSKGGLTPEIEFLSSSVQLGIIFNVLLISLGLADRINHMKNSLTRSWEKIQQQNAELLDTNDEISSSNKAIALLNEAFEVQNQDLRKININLETSEKRFRELAELLPQTVFELDVDAKIIYSNKHGFEITGYSADEFKNGITIFDLFDAQGHGRIKKAMANILALNTYKQGGEYLLRQKDGSMITVFIYSSAILSKGKPVGFRGILIDLSERKKTEEMMVQTEKMMSLGGLAAGMAHEINNPLAGMIQSAQVVRNRLTKTLPANQKLVDELGTSMSVITDFMEKRGILKQLDNIHKAGNHAAKIIDNMLSFARKGDSVKKEHQLDQILDNAIALAQNDYDLKKEYDFKSIEIQREYSPVPRISCEGSKIQQVLFNLLKNASQAMYSQQQKNETPKLILRLLKQGDRVLIEIADNGPGMDEKTRKKIFEPFFTTKGLDKGTGLGLSVSYFIIVDDHGGEMNVDSAPGKGATFSIKLPI